MVLAVRITKGSESHGVGAATEKPLDPFLVFTRGIQSCLAQVWQRCSELMIANSNRLLRHEGV